MKLGKVVFIVIAVLLYNNAAAEGFYVANVGFSNKTMNVKIRQREFEAVFNSLDLSWSWVKGSLFYSLALEQSLNDSIQSFDDGSTRGLLFHNRRDTAGTVGWRFTDNLTAFGGFRQGLTSTYMNAQGGSGQVVSETEIRSYGPFAGLSYAMRLGGSTLSASLAVAKLTGSASLSEPLVSAANLATLSNSIDKIEGAAVGTSSTISWSNPLSKQTSINLRMKFHRYEFRQDKAFAGLDLSYKENFNIISMDVTRRF